MFVFMTLSPLFGNFFFFVKTQMIILIENTQNNHQNNQLLIFIGPVWCLWAKSKIIYFKISTNDGGMYYVRFWKWCATTLLYINNLVFTLSLFEEYFPVAAMLRSRLPFFEEPNTITLPKKCFCINMGTFCQKDAELPTRPPPL